MRCLRPPTHLLQLVPQSPLPKVPVPGPCRVVGGSPIRTPDHALFPRRLHRAARDRRHRPLQQATGLTSCSAPPPKPCARSPPIPSISAQNSASSLSSTLGGRRCSIIRTCIRRCRRRSLGRRQPLDRLPAQLLSARPR